MNGIKFDGDGNWLKCPCCGDVYLHQTTITQNPVEEYTELSFWCEICEYPDGDNPATYSLRFSQHEGLTIVSWHDSKGNVL